MKKRYGLFVKIILTVIAGMLCLTVGLSVLNIHASEDVYVKSFVVFQEKLFQQIDQDIYDFFTDVGAITARINNNSAVEEYLTRDEWEPVEQRDNILSVRYCWRYDSEY